jgi:hypothetical protein
MPHTHTHTAFIHTYIHTYTRIHTYIHTYMHTYIHTYIHTYMHTHTSIHTYMHACMNAHVHTSKYIHTYIHTYIQIYTHTYIHITYVRTHTCMHTYTYMSIMPQQQQIAVVCVLMSPWNFRRNIPTRHWQVSPRVGGKLNKYLRTWDDEPTMTLTIHTEHVIKCLLRQPRVVCKLTKCHPVWTRISNAHADLYAIKWGTCHPGSATDKASFCRRKDMHQALRDLAEQGPGGSGEETVHYAIGQGWGWCESLSYLAVTTIKHRLDSIAVVSAAPVKFFASELQN